jgi:CubicO group peptidase (beta-lactamase class C family)
MVLPFGSYTYEKDSSGVQENTIYDIASLTKSIPTSSLALKLINEGKLDVIDPIIEFIPEFTNPDREKVRIKHLLTHTLHFGFQLSSYKDKTPVEILSIVFEKPFCSEPGKTFHYANATSILLGLVVERVYGKSLDILADEQFFNPLKMNRTTFDPLDEFDHVKIAPTENDRWRGRILQGEVHDESAYMLKRLPCVPGSAGLFSTVPDLLNFLQMLLKGGTLFGRRFLGEKTISRIYTNQIAEIGACTGLGWELGQPQFMGRYYSEHTFGKTGFTGCLCICDINRDIGFVLLSNCTYPTRKNDNRSINGVRRALADIIFSNLE